MRASILLVLALLSSGGGLHGQGRAGARPDSVSRRAEAVLAGTDSVYEDALALRSTGRPHTARANALIDAILALQTASGVGPEMSSLLGRLSVNLETLRKALSSMPPAAEPAGSGDTQSPRSGGGRPEPKDAGRTFRLPRISSLVIDSVVNKVNRSLVDVTAAADRALEVTSRAERIASVSVLLPLYGDYLAIQSGLVAALEARRLEPPPLSSAVILSGNVGNVLGLGGIVRNGESPLVGGGQLFVELGDRVKGGEFHVGVDMGHLIVLPGIQYLSVGAESAAVDPGSGAPARVVVEESRVGAVVTVLYARHPPLAFGISFSTLQGFGVRVAFSQHRR